MFRFWRVMTVSILLFVGIGIVFGQFSSKAPVSSEENEDSSILGSIIPSRSSLTKEVVLGNILKGTLESMHLSKKKVDDSLSQEAFNAYLERIDYGKQFFIKSDIDRLEKFRKLLDDELVSGQLNIVQDSTNIMKERIEFVEKYVLDLLTKKINFEQNDDLETDPKKRKYAADLEELKSRWNKLIRYEVLNRLLDLKEEQDGLNPIANGKNKNKNKKIEEDKKAAAAKNGKKKTIDELEVEARQKILESYKKIFVRLKDEKNDDKLDKFYNSMTKIFDPHTHYLIPEEKEDFDIDMSGKLEGIGALLREEGSHIKVERIIPGSASWRQKDLKEEDIILKVGQGKDEPVDIVDMSLREAVKLIRGKKGSEVRLTVKKPNGLLKVIPITRDVVEIEEGFVKFTVIENKNTKVKVGYILVPKFYRDFNQQNGRNCSDDVRTALEELKKQNIQGVILDLRNNSGGALEDARIMSGLFIEKGPIVQVKDPHNRVEVLTDTDSSITYDGPLIVMINQFSASASEIVAAALQDYQRAIIVGGAFSHGKGTVQAVLDLDSNVSAVAKNYSPLGALKITIQMFYRINGASTQFKGVNSDIVFPDTLSYLESGEQFLEFAIPWDKVKPATYTAGKLKWNLKKLDDLSQKRIKTSAGFKKIEETLTWLKNQKDNTKRKLSWTEMSQYRNTLRAKSDSTSLEEEYPHLTVYPGKNENLKNPVTKEKFEDFKKTLTTDPAIDETLNIFNDMIKG